MCGIIGYIGKKEALTILFQGLKRLEYRGYDSFGFCIFDKEKKHLFKKVGKISESEDEIAELQIQGNVGIAHCLPPDTLIQLADGRILEISKLRNEEEVLTLNLQTLKFEKGKAKIFIHKSPPFLYEIKTPSTSIKVTPKHRMIVFSEGRIREKTGEEISTKD